MYSFNEEEHVHLLDGKPLIGTTTALGILDKPGLVWWASGQACEQFGWRHPQKYKKKEAEAAAAEMYGKITLMDLSGYQTLLDKAYRAHNTRKESAADDGKDMHAWLEAYIKTKIDGDQAEWSQEILETIQPFITWSEKNVKRFLFSEVHCYSLHLWTGGIADFGYVDMQDKYVLADFKSSPKPYWAHAVQLGGYDYQIACGGGFNAKGEKIFHLDRPFDYHAVFCAKAGLDKPFFNKNLRAAEEAFKLAVGLYKNKMRFMGFEQ